jgi:hypothetical protein
MTQDTAFQDRLTIGLKLRAGDKQIEVSGGKIHSLSFELLPFGFRAEVAFALADDQGHGGQEVDSLRPWFGVTDLMEVELSLRAAIPNAEAPEGIETLVLKGLVKERRLTEERYDLLEDAAVIRRRYWVSFADFAQVLWRQHHPYKLYTESSFQDLIDDQKSDHVSIDHQWSNGKEPHPLLFIGQDGGAGETSFYDFAFWLFDGHNAVFSYDYTTGSYRLADAKEPLSDPPCLSPDYVSTVEHIFPELPRCGTRAWNSYSESPACEEIASDCAVPGIFRELLLRTTVQDQAKARLQREAGRIKSGKQLLELTMRRFPEHPLWPGAGFRFDSAHRWGRGGDVDDSSWRIRRIAFSALALDATGETNWALSDNSFKVQLSASLEHADEVRLWYPNVRAPRYPHYVEGKIVSGVGEATEETYEPEEESETGLEHYRIQVPLWDDQIVHAPFDPAFASGHFYTPAYKDERVLIALGFQEALIHRFLDWRPGARMPNEGQGNRIQLGMNEQNRTALTHVYEEDAPIFTVLRTHGQDTATLQMSEGRMVIEVREQQA